MRKIGGLILSLAISSGGVFAAEPPATNSPPDFHELYDLIREHLSGVSSDELNRAAVQALVSGLSPRVSLEGVAGEEPIPPLVTRSNLFEDKIAYVRISRVAPGLSQAVRDTLRTLTTNPLTGVVLDLRFADGQEYSAAVETADLFLKRERPLMDWGKGIVRSKEKDEAITSPLAILIDGDTAGAAEALAAILRECGAALLLGSKSAGRGCIMQEYPLKNGQRLRLASSPVLLADGTALSPQGVKPDIAVEIGPQAERAYFADAYKEFVRTNPAGTAGVSLTNTLVAATNRSRRTRFNEAELVRARRDGYSLDSDAALRGVEGEPDRPYVRDPVLARALDVLKGLAVVRPSRS